MWEDPRPLNFPQCLESYGLKSAARRAADPGYNIGYYWRRTGKRRVKFIPFDSMLRTDHEYAKKIAQEHYRKYSPLSTLVGGSVAYVTLSSRITDNPRNGTEKQFIYHARKIIRYVMPNSISKIGTDKGWLTVKALGVEPLEEWQKRELKKLVGALIPKTRVTFKNHSAAQFDQQLRKLVAADLPEDDDTRAKLEYALKRVQQVTVHSRRCAGVCIKGIHKLRDMSLGEDYKPPKKSAVPDRMLDPETGERADCFIKMSMHRRVEDVQDWEWNDFPDIEEQDCTTPEQHAAMMAV